MEEIPPQSTIPPFPPVSPVYPISKPKNYAIVWIIAGVVILTIGLGIGLVAGKYLFSPQVSSYEDCIIAKGSIVQESYPATCVTKDGKSFRQILTDEEKKNLQPPDPTANWKTYTNSNFSFVIKYYPNLSPQEQIIDNSTFISFVNKEKQSNGPISILVSKTDLDSAIKFTKWTIEGHVVARLLEEKSVEISDAKGIRLHYEIGSPEYTGKEFNDYVILTRGTLAYTLQSQGDLVAFDQILSTFKFIENKPLNSIFSVILPDPFQLMRSTENIASYGFDAVEYLVVTNIPTINIQTLRSSTECGKLTAGQYCLNKGKGWGQAKDIADVTVGGISAKSFYISGGSDNAYHVVQMTQTPLLEFKMNVAGGGLDQRFQSFLATIKFL